MPRVDSSNTKAKRGTGLGSAIAKQIVEMYGDRFGSTLGKGSTLPDGTPSFCRTPEARLMSARLLRWP